MVSAQSWVVEAFSNAIKDGPRDITSPVRSSDKPGNLAPAESPGPEEKSRSLFAVAALILEERKDLEARFRQLVAEWHAERDTLSASPRDLAMCFAYQRIIALGTAAIPLILDELRRTPDHWFWALRAITGENPVPEHSRGRFSEMVACWIAWGEEHGYISRKVTQRLSKSH